MIHILNDTYSLLSDHVMIRENQRVELDLGCGKGRFAIELAAREPDALILGADVMLGRLRRVEKRAAKRGLGNLELLRVEANQLMTRILPDSCLDRVHILCPDPWPKPRHRANRLMSSEFMQRIHRVLKPGGILHFSTDDKNYMAATLENIRKSGLFEEAPAGVLADISDIRTEFELDWLAVGRTVPHVAFRAVILPS